MFAWYWLADLCAQENITFVLGHALYMKAIHGGKVKNDKIDSQKIALLLRSGMLAQAYAYPRGMRATRDLLRRRNQLVRTRAEALAHITNTRSQYNLPPITKKLHYAANRAGVADQFADDSARRMVESDLAVIGALDEELRSLELHLVQHAKIDDPLAYQLLQTIPGVGKILALVMLYELHDARRFQSERHFVSYCRLVRPSHESAGKAKAGRNHKVGSAHLRWAFGEAACLMLRELPAAASFVAKKEKQHGKAKALSILAARIARTAWLMLKRKEAFDVEQFLRH